MNLYSVITLKITNSLLCSLQNPVAVQIGTFPEFRSRWNWSCQQMCLRQWIPDCWISRNEATKTTHTSADVSYSQ